MKNKILVAVVILGIAAVAIAQEVVIRDRSGAVVTLSSGALPVTVEGGTITADVDVDNVGVTSVPSDPFGLNADAAVSAGAAGSFSAKFRHISSAVGTILTNVSTIVTHLAAIETAVEDTDPVFVTPSGYTTTVVWGSSVNLAVTNTAIVTVSAGSRVVVNRADLACASTVSVAVTASLGFAAATLPTTGAGLIWPGLVTGASAFQGKNTADGWPTVVGIGADGEDLRFTMTVPTGGSCQLMVTYRTEGV